MRYVLMLATIIGFGCTNPTIIQKTVTVEKDHNGQVIKRIEVESVTQELGARLLKLEYLKLEEPPQPDYQGPARAGE